MPGDKDDLFHETTSNDVPYNPEAHLGIAYTE